MARTVSQRGQERPTPDTGALRDRDRNAPEVTFTTAGHTQYEQLHDTPPPASLPVIDSPEAASQALGDLFLANADRGDDAANDHLVAELVRRIRAQQNSRDSARGQHPLSQPATTAQVPAPQFGNSPDSGRPPVEQFPRPIPAPGGRPDTTTPMVIDRCVRLPVTSVVQLSADYLNDGFAIPRSLAGVFDELLDTGLLALADPDPDGLRQVILTTAGHTRYQQLHGTPRPTSLGVPDPQFRTRTSGREQVSGPGPLAPLTGGEANHGRAAGEPGVGPLRWARCPDDGRLHLLQPADVVVAATGVRAEALCGRFLPAEGLTLAHGSAAALCMACLAAPIGYQFAPR